MLTGTHPIRNGAVVIQSGRILDVGVKEKMIKNHVGHRCYELQNAVVLPGLVNLHAHLELSALLGAVKASTFPDWVLNLIKAKKKLVRADYASAALENVAALINSGTTTISEICTHGVSPEMLKKSGLRSEVFYEIISMGPRSSALRLALPRDTGLIRNGLSPHAPYTVSEPVLRQIKEYAKKRKLRIAMHVAESKNELRLLQGKKSGFEKLYKTAGWNIGWAPSATSSFEYIHRTGLLNSNLIAAHAVHITERDIHLIKKSGVSIAHCPRSNRETGVGRMPLKIFLDAGITVGLGTDSLASSSSLNMWDEMRYALRIHKRDGVTAKDILALATIGGAKALGMKKELGTLEAGKKADLIAVPLPLKKTGDIYSDLLRETKECTMSVVNGRILRNTYER